MLKELLYVGAGGFVGSVGRYLVSLALRGVSAGFPWATLVANVVGCLLLGLFGGLAARGTWMPQGIGLFLTVGLCGGFTTFSTFSKEALALLQAGSTWGFCLYVLASVSAGLLAVMCGQWIAR